MSKGMHVGVSGFSYPAWKGSFYPEGTKNENLLASYAERLGSVEINSSFYGAPRESTVRSWSEKTQGGFRFAFKAPRLITHIMKLGAGAAENAERFSSSLEPLGQRKGPILFQLPPFMRRDPDLLEKFLKETSTLKDRTFEFRHESWLEDSTYTLLAEHRAGFCIAETEEMEPRFRVTSRTAYFRLRKESYEAKTIDSWARKIREASSGAEETYVFLRHDETGKNAILARRLAKLLDA
jgi:uncharacterized protein YecE (DUF72 family)